MNDEATYQCRGLVRHVFPELGQKLAGANYREVGLLAIHFGLGLPQFGGGPKPKCLSFGRYTGFPGGSWGMILPEAMEASAMTR